MTFWTKQQQQLARQGWDAGLTIVAIAESLNKTFSSTKGFIDRSDFAKRRKPKKQAYIWTRAKIAELERRKRIGESWPEISKALGVTIQAAETAYERKL